MKLFLTHSLFFFIIIEASKYIINNIPCGIPKYLTIEGELNMYLTGTAINISDIYDNPSKKPIILNRAVVIKFIIQIYYNIYLTINSILHNINYSSNYVFYLM